MFIIIIFASVESTRSPARKQSHIYSTNRWLGWRLIRCCQSLSLKYVIDSKCMCLPALRPCLYLYEDDCFTVTARLLKLSFVNVAEAELS